MVVKAVKDMPKPVTLADCKANPKLKDMSLVNWPRLSVQRVTSSPLDAQPVSTGNFEVSDGIAYAVKAENLLPPEQRYTSHFATCPQAAQWRKKDGRIS